MALIADSPTALTDSNGAVLMTLDPSRGGTMQALKEGESIQDSDLVKEVRPQQKFVANRENQKVGPQDIREKPGQGRLVEKNTIQATTKGIFTFQVQSSAKVSLHFFALYIASWSRAFSLFQMRIPSLESGRQSRSRPQELPCSDVPSQRHIALIGPGGGLPGPTGEVERLPGGGGNMRLLNGVQRPTDGGE